jgi:hypothetical protein
MKKKTFLILILGFLLVLTLSVQESQARGRHHGNSGLYAAGAVLGGFVLGAVIGSAISQPHYVSAPQPVYAYPGEPVITHGYAQSPVYAGPPGRWVVVPGMWVHGRWVPAHRVWTPVNP